MKLIYGLHHLKQHDKTFKEYYDAWNMMACLTPVNYATNSLSCAWHSTPHYSRPWMHQATWRQRRRAGHEHVCAHVHLAPLSKSWRRTSSAPSTMEYNLHRTIAANLNRSVKSEGADNVCDDITQWCREWTFLCFINDQYVFTHGNRSQGVCSPLGLVRLFSIHIDCRRLTRIGRDFDLLGIEIPSIHMDWGRTEVLFGDNWRELERIKNLFLVKIE
jgi:hypothetical protein